MRGLLTLRAAKKSSSLRSRPRRGCSLCFKTSPRRDIATFANRATFRRPVYSTKNFQKSASTANHRWQSSSILVYEKTYTWVGRSRDDERCLGLLRRRLSTERRVQHPAWLFNAGLHCSGVSSSRVRAGAGLHSSCVLPSAGRVCTRARCVCAEAGSLRTAGGRGLPLRSSVPLPRLPSSLVSEQRFRMGFNAPAIMPALFSACIDWLTMPQPVSSRNAHGISRKPLAVKLS